MRQLFLLELMAVEDTVEKIERKEWEPTKEQVGLASRDGAVDLNRGLTSKLAPQAKRIAERREQ